MTNQAAQRQLDGVRRSFAQFEREVTSERIRDKNAASKRKGLWVGGMAPLGYDTKDRKITINKSEAETVRTIFRSYLKLGSLNLLMAELRNRGVVTKLRGLKSGKRSGGIPFTRGPLAHLLRNRFYIGEVAFKGETLSGEQPAIIDRTLFEAVQAKLNQQLNNHRTTRANSEALLLGRIFDDRGHRMSPSHTRKRGIKYRYYISTGYLQGQVEQVGTISRIPAVEIEMLVTKPYAIVSVAVAREKTLQHSSAAKSPESRFTRINWSSNWSAQGKATRSKRAIGSRCHGAKQSKCVAARSLRRKMVRLAPTGPSVLKIVPC